MLVRLVLAHLVLARLMLTRGEMAGENTAACDEDLLNAYWETLRNHGVKTAEREGTRVQNRAGIAEGGTNALEFVEEVNLIREAHRRGQRNGIALATICQTGFNAGVSALAFLCGSARQRVPPSVLSFDVGMHGYVGTAEKLLSADYGYAARHTLILGSSLHTLPAALLNGTRCDFAFVDGGHSQHVAQSDIVAFGRMSRAGTLVVVENCNALGQYMKGSWGGIPTVNEAYMSAVRSGNVSHIKQISTGPCHDPRAAFTCRELCVGEYTSKAGGHSRSSAIPD